MNKINLYNQDGSLCSEAQFLMSSKPDDVSRADWMKMLKKFRDQLSPEDLKEFERLKRCVSSAKCRAKNPEKLKAINANWRAENPDYSANWYDENAEKAKQDNAKWRANNPEKVKENNANWYAENSEKVKQDMAKWYAENAEKSKENNAKWRANNPEKFKEQKKRERKRPEIKLRSAVFTAFKKIGQNKPTNTLKLLGCTWEEAKAHFESLFQEGMTWENHGRGEGKWQIDHIRPVASFKGASEEELKQMNHISNLQPLWAIDNIRKGDKWDGELNSEILNSEV